MASLCWIWLAFVSLWGGAIALWRLFGFALRPNKVGYWGRRQNKSQGFDQEVSGKKSDYSASTGFDLELPQEKIVITVVFFGVHLVSHRIQQHPSASVSRLPYFRAALFRAAHDVNVWYFYIFLLSRNLWRKWNELLGSHCWDHGSLGILAMIRKHQWQVLSRCLILVNVAVHGIHGTKTATFHVPPGQKVNIETLGFLKQVHQKGIPWYTCITASSLRTYLKAGWSLKWMKFSKCSNGSKYSGWVDDLIQLISSSSHASI